MRLSELTIKNFRCFEDFTFDFDEASALIVGESGLGKSSLLEAIAKAHGRSQVVGIEDFADLSVPIEIVATLGGFTTTDQGSFPDDLTFGGPPTLRIGFRATWNSDEEAVDSVHGFPDRGWVRASKRQRETLKLLWLPAWRDPDRMLRIIGAASLLDVLVRELSLDAELADAAAAISAATQELAGAQPLSTLLVAARDELARLVAGVPPSAFTLGISATTDRELLQQLSLLLDHNAGALPIGRQSGGLAQLSVFAFALLIANTDARPLLMVDEPEASLPPHAQRALTTRLQDVGAQSLIVTHSSSVLDRADLRQLIRLREGAQGAEAVATAPITQVDATRLSRYSTPETAEAFFARVAILVEGESDRVAILTLASRRGLNLDARGVSVVSLEGGGGISTFLALIGPQGLDLSVAGMCDEDHEGNWRDALNASGLSVADRAAMNAAGFFVCSTDLEDELFGTLGDTQVEAVINAEGDGQAFATFSQQPSQAGKSHHELLLAFVKKQKVRWAPLLVDALDISTGVPQPLDGVLNDV